LTRIFIFDKAFKHLLDLHVLFASTNAFDPDGNPLPIAKLALTLDDEVQYRCAGYIQAEIERYAEFLGNDDEDDDKSELSDAEVGSDEEGAAKSKVKPKKSRKDRTLEHYHASFSRANILIQQLI
jgi:cohesin complex subunit SA-1/2